MIYFVIIGAITMSNMHFIWKYLDTTLKIGLAVYALGLSIMTTSTFYLFTVSRNVKQMKIASALILIGSVLFWISDNTLS